jgi:hypothetical protein
MDFTLTSDQTTLMGALDSLAERYTTKPTDAHGFALVGGALERELEEAGFFDIASEPDLGPVAAAMAVERLARLPYTAEVALSMLAGPHLPESLPRPFALVESGKPGRFVATAKTVIVVDRDAVGIARPSADALESVESIYAYPMGHMKPGVAVTPLSSTDAANVRKWIRVALAAEMAGLLKAAVDATVEHTTVRKQFGRPLGTFQALRHRLAECAVLTGGVRWLALKAAWSGDDGDAALAALHAQESATRVAYDVHQMLGAMGMTLEHPLHLWTYRMKALLSELGGRAGQANAAARYCFEPASPN